MGISGLVMIMLSILPTSEPLASPFGSLSALLAPALPFTAATRCWRLTTIILAGRVASPWNVTQTLVVGNQSGDAVVHEVRHIGITVVARIGRDQSLLCRVGWR